VLKEEVVIRDPPIWKTELSCGINELICTLFTLKEETNRVCALTVCVLIYCVLNETPLIEKKVALLVKTLSVLNAFVLFGGMAILAYVSRTVRPGSTLIVDKIGPVVLLTDEKFTYSVKLQ
jgi:hypothetical protein